MSTGIIRVSGRFNITPAAASPTILSVGETYVRPRRRNADTYSDALRLASRIQPYLQSRRQNFLPSHLAHSLVEQQGWSLAYYGDVPERVLAFGFLARLRPALRERLRLHPERTEYAFLEFGVTTPHDLREQPQGLPAEHYLRAARALLHCAVKSLPPQDNVYVIDHPHDTRSGYMFKHAGFLPTADAPEWQNGQSSMVATAGYIEATLFSDSRNAFLLESLPPPGNGA